MQARPRAAPAPFRSRPRMSAPLKAAVQARVGWAFDRLEFWTEHPGQKYPIPCPALAPALEAELAHLDHLDEIDAGEAQARSAPSGRR